MDGCKLVFLIFPLHSRVRRGGVCGGEGGEGDITHFQGNHKPISLLYCTLTYQTKGENIIIDFSVFLHLCKP